jgi:hypothetical protein
MAFCGLICVPPVLAWAWWGQHSTDALLWLALWLLLPLFRFAPSRLPDRLETVGDLVRQSMGRNYKQLKRSSGTGNRSDIWLAICGLTREQTGHDGPIDRETTFFAEYA